MIWTLLFVILAVALLIHLRPGLGLSLALAFPLTHGQRIVRTVRKSTRLARSLP